MNPLRNPGLMRKITFKFYNLSKGGSEELPCNPGPGLASIQCPFKFIGNPTVKVSDRVQQEIAAPMNVKKEFLPGTLAKTEQ